MVRKCPICEYVESELLFTYKLPIFMGQNDYYEEKFDEVELKKCNNCKSVFNNNLIDVNILYKNNHNVETIGKLWENHYIEFSDFILKNSIEKINLLEIGDPGAKIAKKIHNNFKKYDIIEPNPYVKSFDNVNIKKGFLEDLKIEEYDVIVLSHVIEHIYEPISFFKLLKKYLKKNGNIIISIPNLKYLLDTTLFPSNIVHFEHTYFYDEENINLLLSKCGLVVKNIKKYDNHSIFFNIVEGEENINETNDYSFNFLELNKKSMNKIIFYNDYLKDSPFYIFSCHVFSQYLLSNGLNYKNLLSIVDNSILKENKYLYGFNYKTILPKDIKEQSIVIISHMGIYENEIKIQLEKLNKNLILI